MGLFKFAPPKGPGYGIASDFHVSVLAAKAQLPSALQIANPKGEAGAVAGFIAPLAKDATREDLAKPLARGAYVAASPDRKTVLQMIVVSKEEAGFDPEALIGSSLAGELSEELLARIRATWTVVQFTFKSHDAAVLPAMEFLSKVARRTAELTDGCIADPLSERYLMPAQLLVTRTDQGKVFAPDHVSTKARVSETGLHAYTLGMRKFALPEIEMSGVNPSLEGVAKGFLLGVCQGALSGRLLRPGDRVGPKSGSFQVAEGGLDRGLWEGIAVLELLPPIKATVDDTLRQWVSEEKL